MFRHTANFFQTWSFLALFTATAAHAAPQPPDPSQRYLNEVFAEHIRTSDIVFAERPNDATGKTEKLTMRVFEPKGDKAKKRVLFVLTPGGGFVRHEDYWMDSFGEQMARAGYVVAINRYRLSSSIDNPERYHQALFKAVSDQKAAIRYFVKDAAGENRFRIDPNNIFIGGHSAGGITSMTVAYLDATDKLPPVAQAALRANGGLEGDSVGDNPQFKPRGVINLSGLLTDVTILDRGEPPLLSLHGDRDDVVPVDRDSGRWGSIPIHAQANKVGIANSLYVIPGAAHNDTSDPLLCPECIPLLKRFIFTHLDPTSLAPAVEPVAP